MTINDRIEINPQVMLGKPVVRGTRITVEAILRKIAEGAVTAADFRGMHKLKQAAGKRFKAGVVLYDGEVAAPFGDGMYAVPIRRLWDTAAQARN